MGAGDDATRFEARLVEGLRLREGLDEMQSILREGLVDPPIELLDSLHELLNRRFTAEEEGSYLGEPLRNRPRLSARCSRLRRQHPKLIAELDRLREIAADLSTKKKRKRLKKSFKTFRAHLRAHEYREDHLLQDAVGTDIGAMD